MLEYQLTATRGEETASFGPLSEKGVEKIALVLASKDWQNVLILHYPMCPGCGSFIDNKDEAEHLKHCLRPPTAKR